ncbi:hypothetical protein AAFF_G00335830 [Aldrovandia affinis]|uniref:Uncharacterized protein n=1 Tax=Aldrovandia affinis TaxID=143900 RepID=A0AAD7SLB2_9TELE|nr:hypothetical protein AAFF_G00335830 [Aldrovandia affinis]
MSFDESALRDAVENGHSPGEGPEGILLERMANLPADLYTASDFRGKFKKMRSKKRPTILQGKGRCSDTLFPQIPAETLSTWAAFVWLSEGEMGGCGLKPESRGDFTARRSRTPCQLIRNVRISTANLSAL